MKEETIYIDREVLDYISGQFLSDEDLHNLRFDENGVEYDLVMIIRRTYPIPNSSPEKSEK